MGMDGRGHGGGGAENVSDGVPQGGDNGLPSRRVPGEGRDEDGDTRALLEKACAGHNHHTGGGEPPPPVM